MTRWLSDESNESNDFGGKYGTVSYLANLIVDDANFGDRYDQWPLTTDHCPVKMLVITLDGDDCCLHFIGI